MPVTPKVNIITAYRYIQLLRSLIDWKIDKHAYPLINCYFGLSLRSNYSSAISTIVSQAVAY